MPQADVSRLVSQVRIKVEQNYRRLKNPKGSQGRHEIIGQILTGLFKYERIELLFTKADESRGYAERLISEAIRHGDTHAPTMELADYWLTDKTVVHKLFKVLAPRYKDYTTSYTRILRISVHYPDGRYPRSVLELKGNPFPPLTPDHSSNRNLIHNVLFDEAKREYRAQKYLEMAEQLAAAESDSNEAQSAHESASAGGTQAAPETDSAGTHAAPETDSAGTQAAPETDSAGTQAAPETDSAGTHAAPETDSAGTHAAPETDSAGTQAAPETDSAGTHAAPETDSVEPGPAKSHVSEFESMDDLNKKYKTEK